MREIKFRGMTRKKGEKVRYDGTPVEGNWVYGGVMQGKGDFSIIYENMTYDKRVVYTDTLCQYTEKKDKNEKEIYEGDIVKCQIDTNEYIYYKVIYHVAYNCWWLSFLKTDICEEECMEDEYFHHYNSENIEVIGNIFDNPELLEREV